MTCDKKKITVLGQSKLMFKGKENYMYSFLLHFSFHVFYLFTRRYEYEARICWQDICVIGPIIFIERKAMLFQYNRLL